MWAGYASFVFSCAGSFFDLILSINTPWASLFCALRIRITEYKRFETTATLNHLGFWMVTLWNSYVLIAFIDLEFQSRQIAQSLAGEMLFGICGKDP